MTISLLFPSSPFMMSERVFPPLGILSLATYCKHKEFKQVVVHDNVTSDDVEKLDHADIFGLSCTTPQYSEALNIKKKIRQLYPKSLIVIGGAHCSGFLQTCKNDGWDRIVVGEGEQAFYKLLQDYQESKHQVVYKEPFLDIDTLPIPDRNLIDINQYRYERDGKRFTTMMTSRGCPFSCAFCSSIWGKKYRYRKIELVKQEIDYLIDDLKFEGIMFVDDVWSINKKRSIELCNYIKSKHIVWRCLLRADLINEDILSLLKDSNCIEIGIGIESGSQTILNKMMKGTTVEKNSQAVQLCKAAGIRVKTFLIMGLPGENLTTIEETKQWLLQNRPDDFDITVYVPYGNSHIYNNKADYDIDWSFSCDDMFYKGKPHEYHPVISTSALSAENIQQLRDDFETEMRLKL